MTRPERFPEFLDEWRDANGEDYTPLSYLDSSPDGLSFVVAAQWLFAPDFVEYRGGVFRTELPRGLGDKGHKVLDDWFVHFSGDVSKVEEKGNLLILWDLFSEADAHDDDLVQLARTLERLWLLQLKDQFPDREFTFAVLDGDGSYGPQVTFCSKPPRARQAPVVVYDVRQESADVTAHGIHVDFPRPLLDELAGRRLVEEIDLRSVLASEGQPDFAGVEAKIADFLVNQTDRHLALTAFEQLWSRQRSFAVRLLAALLPQIDAAGRAGRTVGVDLVDLSEQAKAEAINELQRIREPQLSAPVTVFRYL